MLNTKLMEVCASDTLIMMVIFIFLFILFCCYTNPDP